MKCLSFFLIFKNIPKEKHLFVGLRSITTIEVQDCLRAGMIQTRVLIAGNDLGITQLES